MLSTIDFLESDKCKSNPCLNGGTCINDVHHRRYTCTCLAGDFGRRCEQRSNITDSPRITLVNVKVIAEGTSLVKIPCIAEGIPTPVVT
ncbi:coagulation factor VII-like [Mytilus galloprovincialis]|uniref:coagulation factor VII-like n=1 Tax=Mytilus galloprovincialis TaxID=29158 RepID=UPI003F7BE41A